jgi:hypothetical protein
VHGTASARRTNIKAHARGSIKSSKDPIDTILLLTVLLCRPSAAACRHLRTMASWPAGAHSVTACAPGLLQPAALALPPAASSGERSWCLTGSCSAPAQTGHEETPAAAETAAETTAVVHAQLLSA